MLEVLLFVFGSPKRAELSTSAVDKLPPVVVATVLRRDPRVSFQSFLVAPAGGRLWRSRRVANRVSSLWISSITSMSGSCAIMEFASGPADDMAWLSLSVA